MVIIMLSGVVVIGLSTIDMIRFSSVVVIGLSTIDMCQVWVFSGSKSG